MNLICVLVLLLISSVEARVDEMVLSRLSKPCICNWSKPFLVGIRPHTVLYLDRDETFEVDFEENMLINVVWKPAGTEYLDDYFTGCLIRLKNTFFTVIIYKDQILKFNSKYFRGGSELR